MNFESIPIRSSLRASKIPNGYWMAKSAVKFINWQDQPTLIHGFSFRKDKNESLFISRMEVFERLFACHDFVQSSTLESYQWPDRTHLCKIPAEQVLLGSSPGFPNAKFDASGLGWHTVLEKAEQHAILEVIERHLLCHIWYYDLQLVGLGKMEQLSDDLYLEFATVEADIPLPFILAIISDKKDACFVCGSSIGLNSREAKKKAMEEAFMLLDGVLHQDNVLLNPNLKTQGRLLSLRNPLVSKTRHLYYNSKISRNMEWNNYFSNCLKNLKQICENIFKSSLNIRCVLLCENGEGCLVRAICPAAMMLKEIRIKYRSNVPPDPFC